MGRRGRSDEGCRGEGYGEHYLDLMAPRRRSRRALTGGGENRLRFEAPSGAWKSRNARRLRPTQTGQPDPGGGGRREVGDTAAIN